MAAIDSPIAASANAPAPRERVGARGIVQQVAFELGAALVVFPASLLLAALAFLAVGQPVQPLAVGIAVLASAGWCLYVARENSGSRDRRTLVRGAAVLLCAVAIYAMLLAVAGAHYDVSPDGQTYHQPAVIDLAMGWNPFWGTGPVPQDDRLIGYPKGPWIVSAGLYTVLQRIEPTKVLDLAYAVAAFLLTFSAALSFPRAWPPHALAVSLIAAANPVAISQALSFYVDGQLASLMLAFVAVAILSVREPRRAHLLLLPLLLSLIASTKLTGAVYAGVAASTLMAGTLVFGPRQDRRAAVAAAAGLALALCVVGFNPYVSNLLAYRTPFYPMAGPNTTDVVAQHRPANLAGANQLQMTVLPLVAQPQIGTQPMQFRMPSRVTRDDVAALASPDARAGAFGPYYGVAAVLGILVLLAGIRDSARAALASLASVLVLALSAFILPEPWWGRFVPQLWLVPAVATLAPAWLGRGVLTRSLAFAVAGIMALNSYYVADVYLDRQSYHSFKVADQLAGLHSEPGELLVNFGNFTSTGVRLQEAGIPYQEVSAQQLASAACTQRTPVWESEAVLCVIR